MKIKATNVHYTSEIVTDGNGKIQNVKGMKIVDVSTNTVIQEFENFSDGLNFAINSLNDKYDGDEDNLHIYIDNSSSACYKDIRGLTGCVLECGSEESIKACFEDRSTLNVETAIAVILELKERLSRALSLTENVDLTSDKQKLIEIAGMLGDLKKHLSSIEEIESALSERKQINNKKK